MRSKPVRPLINLLKSERESDRSRAARLLPKIGKPAVEPLITLAIDKSATPESRSAAAFTLGFLGDERAIKPLASMLRDERSFVRQQAAASLAQLGNSAIEEILQMANSSTTATREAAFEALGGLNTPRAIDKLIEGLTDPNAAVRSAAVHSLGETGSERAVQPLLNLMRDESSTLRGQAAASLGRLGKVAAQGLVTALRDSKPSTRSLAAEALGDTGAKEAVAPLIILIQTDASGARGDAIEALGKIGDASAIDVIVAFAKSGSVSVRKKSLIALSRFTDRRTIDALLLALSDVNEDNRQLAATGLGDIGDQQATLVLERVAQNDVNSDVREAAVKAIEQIKAREKNRFKDNRKN
jgi:HEAT repeat protein